MKAIKYLSIAAASLILASCAKEEFIPDIEPIPAGPTTVTFVSSCETKTSIGEDLQTTSWDKNENVLLWEGETALAIGSKNYSDDGNKLTITANVTSIESTFYSVIGPKDNDNVTRTSAAVLATQNPAKASFDPNAEILVAQPATCGEGNTVALRYNRPVAITVATLKNLEEGEKVQSVKITANQPLTGNVNFTYYGTNVKAEMAKEGGNTIICNYTTNNTVVQGKEGEGYIFPVYFISLNAEVTVFEFEVSTDKHKYYKKVVRPNDSPIILNDNRVASFGFKLDNADKADAEGDKFVKVTAEPADWSGEYLLVYEAENNKALCWTGVDAESCNVAADVANGEIATKPDGAVTLEIASMTEGYSIKVKGGENNGKYIGQNSYANGINISENSQANTIEIAESSAKISGTGSSGNSYVALRYNKASDQKRFRYYKSGQEAVQLYKKAAGGYGKFTLATPENIKVGEDGKSIVWDAVENAGKYSVSYTGTDLTVGESGTVSKVVEECIIENVTPDYYSVTVKALPKDDDENYQESAVSAPTDITLGTPTLKKPEIATKNSATTGSITITWTADARATNGFTCWITTVVTGEGGKEETGVQIGDAKQIASNAEKTVTFDNLDGNTSYRVFVQANAVTTPKAYAESPSTYKTVKTAATSTIKAILDTDITGSGATFAVEDAQIIAFGTSVCWLKDNTGAILAQVAIPTDAKIGDHVSISGTVDSNHRFNNQSIITFKEEGTYTEPAQVAVLDAAGMESRLGENFTAGEYVKYAGKVTSSGDYYRVNVGSQNAQGTLFETGLADLSTVGYATITGYLTYLSNNKYLYTIATEVVKNTLDLGETELTWDASATDSRDITITSDDTNWNFTPTDNTDWNISKSGNTLSVSPVSANTSTDKKELTVTLAHATNTQLTKTITLTQNGKEAVYEKVTSVNDLSVGDEIVITSSDGKMVMGEQRDNNVGAVETTPVVSEDYLTIKLPSSVLKLTLAAGTTSSQYALTWKSGDAINYLYAASSSSNHLKSQTDNDNNGSWTITISNETASITANGTNSRKVLQYNPNNGSPIFSCYGSASQRAVAIYKIDNTTSRNLQFSANADTRDIKDGKNVNALKLTGITEGGINYSSTNTAVATIDNSGAITLVSAGTTIIKANAPKTATLKAGEASYTLTVTDTREKDKLASPTDLSSGTPTSNGTTLSWNSVTNAESYKVEYKESGESNWTSKNVITTSCELTGLKASTSYSWQVTAIPLDTEKYSNSDAAIGSDFTTAAGSGPSRGAKWSHTFANTNELSVTGVNITENNVTLKFTADPKHTSFESASPARGMAWSKTATTITISGYQGGIDKISFVFSANATGYSASVSVGGVQMGDSQAITKDNNKTYTFNSDKLLTGDIVITTTKDSNVKTFYWKSIVINP